MTEIITQQTLGLSQATRQDVVSALLDDYSNSFEGYEHPVMPAVNELPPALPPRMDRLKDKPLPAAGSPAHRMSMQFPLRDDQDAPVSPDGSPISQRRNRIIHRSLSRDGKPPSLKLVVSNGATAIISPTPAYPIPTKILSSSPPQNKKLPSLRNQSEREDTAESSIMGSVQSSRMTELERNDSFHSQRETRLTATESSTAADTTPVVKRKPLGSNVLNFVSLAEGEDAPRGRQGAPLPPKSAPRAASTKSNVDKATTTTHENIPQVKKELTNSLEGSMQELNRMPPTPPEEEKTTPSPPRKALINTGPSLNLPPRGPISPLHQRGKSSTGFNLLKACRPAPPIPTGAAKTVTPAMTPSPNLKPGQHRDQDVSPVSPLPPPSNQHYGEPFLTSQATNLQAPAVPPPAPTPPARPALLLTATVNPPEPSPSVWPSTAPSHTFAFTFSTHPASTILSRRASPPLSPTSTCTPTSTSSPPPINTTNNTNTTPPFTPLTRRPIPLAQTLIPHITPTQLSCYTSHRHNVWSNNWFQPMGCMVCHKNERDRKWCCTWCRLRVCGECSEELAMVPGRRVEVLIQAKRKVVIGEEQGKEGKEVPGIVVMSVQEDEEEECAPEKSVAGGEEKGQELDQERRGRSLERFISS